MNLKKVIPPKRRDRVASDEREGTFEVVGVNSLKQTAKLRPVDGSTPVILNVPWNALKFNDE